LPHRVDAGARAGGGEPPRQQQWLCAGAHAGLAGGSSALVIAPASACSCIRLRDGGHPVDPREQTRVTRMLTRGLQRAGCVLTRGHEGGDAGGVLLPMRIDAGALPQHDAPAPLPACASTFRA
jgi:hypothetical protein